jgi:DNA polymerase-1
MLAWDTETGLIAEAKLAPPLACITYSDGVNADIVHWKDGYDCAEWLLKQETTTANGPYDLAVVWAQYPGLRDLVWDAVVNGRVHDVQTRQKLIDVGAGKLLRIFKRLPDAEKVTLLRYNLSDLHARYFGTKMEKDEYRLTYGHWRDFPLSEWPEGAIRYALNDAVVTSRVHQLQDQEAALNAKHNLWDEAAQVRSHFSLHLMSAWGMATDPERVDKVIAHIDEETPAIVARLKSVDLVRDKGKKANVRNEKLAKQMMYAAVKDAGELTDTGYKKVKAGEMDKNAALKAGYIKIDEEWCEISGYPALIDYYHFRQNQLLRTKLLSVRRAASFGLPIQTDFEVLLRECFTARPGCTLIACDFNLAELVSLAQVTYSAFGYSKMRDVLNAGMDIHLDFGSQVYAKQQGVILPYEKASALHKAKDPAMKDMRQLAKAADFGYPGGLGAASFQSYSRKAWGVELTFDQSKELKRDWLNHFPEMRDYFLWVSDLMEAGDGRADIQQFHTLRWRGGCYYTQGCNTLFQGLTADAAKAALFEVSRLCYSVPSSPLYGCRPVLFVHDEIIMEAPLEQAAEAAKELERVMVEVYQRYTPDVRIAADAHLMSHWSKDAEATYDERGKLVPWNPPQDEDEHAERELLAA